jgi:hypothetical protein
MSDGVNDSSIGQISLQFVDIPSYLLDLAMLDFRDIPDEHMNADLILGELGRDLTANKGLRLIGYLQATIDSVVIGERNERHPFFPQSLVQVARVGVAIGKFETPKQPLDRTIAET